MSAPQKKPNNSGWYSWPIIIVLFALGIWPVALILLFVNIFGEGKRRTTPSSQRKPSAEERMEAAVEDAVDRALAKAREAGNRATASRRKSAAQESLDRAMAAAQSDMDRAVADVERAAEDLAKEFAADERKAAAPKKAAKKKKKKKKEPEKLPGKLLRVIGLCLLALGAVVGVDAAAEILQGWTYYLEDLFMGLGFAAAGGIMWGRGQYLARMARRTNRYTNAIGEAEAMPMDEIAKRVNRSPAKAARELQKLIDKGYLGEDAYIDRERGYFLRFGATVEEEEPEEAAPPPPKEAEEGYSGILRDFRRVNDRIADEALSRKIDRLEQVSAMIFKEVEEHPEKRERIRTFFDYYLPTTQKLLEAYAEFEETGVDGEHLREAKERIEQTMDGIVEGFEHQLDQLYTADAMDVVSDIKVMETMLHRDTASVAKDFGYDKTEKKQEKPVQSQSSPEEKDDGGFQQLQL